MPEKILRAELSSEYWFQEGCHVLETANHPDDPDVSIARVRVAAGARTRWHCLDHTSERYLVIAGEGRVDVGELEGKSVASGDVVFIPPGTAQRITCTGTRELVFYAICSPRFIIDCYRDLEPDA